MPLKLLIPDGDEVGDNADAFPNDPNETVDTDGDEVGDNADEFPEDIRFSTQEDYDGFRDTSIEDLEGSYETFKQGQVDALNLEKEQLNAAHAEALGKKDGKNCRAERREGGFTSSHRCTRWHRINCRGDNI